MTQLDAIVSNRQRRSDLPLKSLSLSALLASVRRHTGRAMVWLPWLGVALVIAAALSPGTVVASRLAFQSPPTNTPPPPAADTPVPPPPATDTPVPVAPEPAPTEAAPIQPSPTAAPAPAGEQPAPGTVLTPTGVLSPTAEATGLPVTSPEVTPPVQETESPTRLPKPKIEPSPASTGGQPIVNWV